MNMADYCSTDTPEGNYPEDKRRNVVSSSQSSINDVATNGKESLRFNIARPDDIDIVIKTVNDNSSFKRSNKFATNKTTAKCDDSKKRLEGTEKISDTYSLLERLAGISSGVEESPGRSNICQRHLIYNRPTTISSQNMFRIQALRNRLDTLKKLIKQRLPNVRLRRSSNFKKHKNVEDSKHLDSSQHSETLPNLENSTDSEQFASSVCSTDSEDTTKHSTSSEHSTDSEHSSNQGNSSHSKHSTTSKHSTDSEHSSSQEDSSASEHSPSFKHSTDSKHSSSQEDSSASEHSPSFKHSTDSKHSSSQEDLSASEHSPSFKHSTDSKHSSSQEDSSASEHSPSFKHSTDSKHSSSQEDSSASEHSSSFKHSTDSKHSSSQEDSSASEHLISSKRSTDSEHSSSQEDLSASERSPSSKHSTDSEHSANREDPPNSQHSTNSEHSTDFDHSSSSEYLTSLEYLPSQKNPTSSQNPNLENPTNQQHLANSEHLIIQEHPKHFINPTTFECSVPSQSSKTPEILQNSASQHFPTSVVGEELEDERSKSSVEAMPTPSESNNEEKDSVKSSSDKTDKAEANDIYPLLSSSEANVNVIEEERENSQRLLNTTASEGLSNLKGGKHQTVRTNSLIINDESYVEYFMCSWYSSDNGQSIDVSNSQHQRPRNQLHLQNFKSDGFYRNGIGGH